jgi:alginate O-acetyltransferase complex protein AlgJ
MKNIFKKESIIVLLFLLGILLPVSGMWLKLDRFKQLNENRQLAKPPPLGFTTEFRSSYTRYFNDHFGFRSLLVRANFIFRYVSLGISPSNQVIFGKDGWLFYTGEGEIEDFRGITKYDAKTLEKWAKTLEMKRIWLEERGIRYLFVVPPNKSSIYGEFLPDPYNRVRESNALDELFEYLKKHTRVKVVDFRQALLAAKSKERVYHRTNTHWNEYGAFIAYRQIMKPVVQWFPSLRIQTIDDYLIEKKIGGGGDLADLIGGTEFIKEEYINLKPLDNNSLKIEDIDDITKSPITFEQNDSSFPRALIFRDSFFSSVAPFLAGHFQHSKYYWQNWNTSTPIEEIVSSQKPDIVIEEITERLVKTRMADFVGNPPKFITSNLR